MLNQRKLPKSVYDNHIDMLRRILSKHYRVIPILLKKNSVYIHPYEYTSSSDKPDKLELKHRKDSAAYIYNIFMGANARNKVETYDLLSKIRILQLLKNHPVPNESEIIDNLYNMFGYKKDNIELDIDELLIMNMIKQTPDVNVNYSLNITRIGLNNIDKLIYEYSYLRIILDDILVPEGLVDDLKSPEEFRDNIAMWNIAHIQRLCRFILLVDAVEEQEKATFGARYPIDKFAEWEITPKLKREFTKTALRIIWTLKDMKQDYRVRAFDLINRI